MNQQTEPIVLRGAEVSDAIARLLVGGLLATLTLAIIGLVQGIRHGFNHHYIIFLSGGIISPVVLIALPLHAAAVAAGKARRPSFVGMLVSFAGFIPYLLGVYLVLYEGLWRLSQLRGGFTIWVVLLSFFYVMLGFIIVKSIDRASSFARKVDGDEVVLR